MQYVLPKQEKELRERAQGEHKITNSLIITLSPLLNLITNWLVHLSGPSAPWHQVRVAYALWICKDGNPLFSHPPPFSMIAERFSLPLPAVNVIASIVNVNASTGDVTFTYYGAFSTMNPLTLFFLLICFLLASAALAGMLTPTRPRRTRRPNSRYHNDTMEAGR